MLLAVVLTATPLVGLGNSVASAGELQSGDSRVRLFSVSPPNSDYWTAARMRAAKPASILSRHGHDETPSVGQPGGGAGPMAPPIVKAARPWDRGGIVTKTVGKLFFSVDAFDASCSASVVNSTNRSTVVTAAHCVNPEGDLAKDWIFVPGYNDGAAPYGKWSAKYLAVSPGWLDRPGGNLNEDVGLAVMNPLNGKRLADVVGSNAIAFNAPLERNVYSFGYPAERRFDGESLHFCQGVSRPDTFEAQSTDLGLDCDMNGGSSGGPFLAALSADKVAVISVNSFGYDALPDVMFGPRFDDSIKAVYDVAQATSLENSPPRP